MSIELLAPVKQGKYRRQELVTNSRANEMYYMYQESVATESFHHKTEAQPPVTAVRIYNSTLKMEFCSDVWALRTQIDYLYIFWS